jgi:penicillin-binding protein 2
MDKSRVIAAYIFVFVAFTILYARYAYLQLFGHTALLQQSINNYSSTVSSLPTRGEIIDHNGVILADNKVSYVLAILPKNINNPEDIFNKLINHINLTDLDRKKFYTQYKHARNYDWIIIKDDLSNTEIASFTSHNYEFPSIAIFARTKRYYPFDEIYSHSIGYVGRVSTTDKNKMTQDNTHKNYLSNDYIGKSGLEKFYENKLRGSLGKKIIKTDAGGNEVGLLTSTQATDGNTIQLTIDNKLQKAAWQALGNRKGAIVAINPQTGGVLTLVSKPGYDPNWFIDGITPEDWGDLSNNEDKPLLNRATLGTYPPGSTFKPFLALAALYLKIRTPESKMNDPGYFMIPGSSHKFRGSQPNGLGVVDLYKAITYSSDAYFYKLGLDMGIDRAAKTMAIFGFGNKTGIDLPHENSGLMPTRRWKAKRFTKDPYQKNWLAADSVTFGIGQGFNHYTPLQMAFATTIIANDGNIITPHLLDKVINKNGTIIESYPIKIRSIPIAKSDIEFIKKAMQNVVAVGTAHRVGAGLKYTMAGKTGTAQVVSLNKNSRTAKFQGAKYRDHSWFIAFAPVDKPQIAIAVIVENGGFGGAAAAPIVRQLFDLYLLGSANPEIEDNIYKTFIPSDNVYGNKDGDDNEE